VYFVRTCLHKLCLSVFTSGPISLLACKSIHTLFFMVFIFSDNGLTSPAHTDKQFRPPYCSLPGSSCLVYSDHAFYSNLQDSISFVLLYCELLMHQVNTFQAEKPQLIKILWIFEIRLVAYVMQQRFSPKWRITDILKIHILNWRWQSSW
jgi:hypothetical protein